MRLNLAQSGAAQGLGSKECGLQCMSLLSKDQSRHSYELPLSLFLTQLLAACACRPWRIMCPRSSCRGWVR